MQQMKQITVEVPIQIIVEGLADSLETVTDMHNVINAITQSVQRIISEHELVINDDINEDENVPSDVSVVGIEEVISGTINATHMYTKK